MLVDNIRFLNFLDDLIVLYSPKDSKLKISSVGKNKYPVNFRVTFEGSNFEVFYRLHRGIIRIQYFNNDTRYCVIIDIKRKTINRIGTLFSNQELKFFDCLGYELDSFYSYLTKTHISDWWENEWIFVWLCTAFLNLSRKTNAFLATTFYLYKD